MATSGQGLWRSLATGSVRGYDHAAQIFRSNDYARAPKSKYLFYVRIILNPNAQADGITSLPDFKSELNYLVKTVDMPKFEMDIQEYNQYNRKALVQRQIKYNPVTIKFHDDNQGTLRNFWKAYYNFYFMDGRYNRQQHQLDDRYLDRKTARWGLDTNIKGGGAGAYPHFISHIEIYSLYHGKAQPIVIYNPIISNFSHDTHDYAENTGVLEASITFRYTGVGYLNKVSASAGLAGFGLDAPEAYDVNLSDLTDGTGRQVDPQTGELYNPQEVEPDGSTEVDPLRQFFSRRPVYSAQEAAMILSNPGSPNYLTNAQLSAMLYNISGVVNGAFNFPVGNPVVTQFTEYGAVPLAGSNLSRSDGQTVPSPDSLANLYTDSSWQKSLYLKGYSPSQITAAEKFLASAKLTSGANIQEVAENYLRNPLSPRVLAVGTPVFGNPVNRPTNINWNNPSTSTQPIYNSNSWQSQLIGKGYTSAQISAAQRFLATVKVSPGTDLSTIAENYIKRLNNNFGSGAVRTPTSSSSNLNNELNWAGGTPNFDERTGTYRPV